MRTKKIPKWYDESGLREVGYPSINHVIAIKGLYGNTEVHSRAYHILQRQIEQIIAICKVYDIEFVISGSTTYENKDTCTIKFWLKKEREDTEFLHNNPNFLNKYNENRENAT